MSTTLVLHERVCMFCAGPAMVAAAVGATDLDVDAEFSSQGRAFGDDNEMIGVGCHLCSALRHEQEGKP